MVNRRELDRAGWVLNLSRGPCGLGEPQLVVLQHLASLSYPSPSCVVLLDFHWNLGGSSRVSHEYVTSLEHQRGEEFSGSLRSLRSLVSDFNWSRFGSDLILPSPEKMVKRRCLRLCSRRRPVPVRLAGLVFQGLVRASPLRFGVTAVLRLTAQRTAVL
ncbi:hypothetical protein F2Q69_00045917 [Brassica cretica]|uniref:Uncharacterized protein n=1 Tax=Brassica cretica TaxID=69181 RepID=A0A8S9PLH2_BRACR|nr:hypothetical protein F2Q69_00045917 [Brassica cretica]